MLHSRLRPLSRRHQPTNTPAPAPEFQNQDASDSDEAPEDLFGAFLPHLFPDDVHSFHGDPGQHLLYSSPRYGDLNIMVPSYPGSSQNRSGETTVPAKTDGSVNQVNEERKLFAHFLWSAGMVVAEGVEEADTPAAPGKTETEAQKESRELWSIKGESVLELGAGAALPSIICALANASTVTATDHPSSPALSGAIAFNFAHNLSKRPVTRKVSLHPHEWGVLDDAFSAENKGAFTRIVAADCFWMRSQHENLSRTMEWFLAPGGKVWVVAGFHTGRAIVAAFLETVVEDGFVVERIYERDLVARAEGGGEVRREWRPVRDGENVENQKRWCVVAVLKRG
ncbi:uncharacterized protein N7479_007182 [Penicillium vulpinum]|uniref:Nicotinamide N-methyltransferase n=1 Tax=Penicillium vulpinum TaxID=29845 RepID=A0A1V6S1K7_9EURO|nr:uncharacterized protein N7479_007182 [Penicillium vulpinum]KAJ5960032.1 hypothetical protein N7479_007182 [Penicillium vulpinum]OQE07523.1 hypothetical protein PENVUL_c013G03996 [Penicillium vulpinum]